MCLQFNSDGFLLPGIHTVKWDAFYTKYSFSNKRIQLLSGLKKALISLKHAGCPCVYIDGSFVTTKIEPNDFDACYFCDNNIFTMVEPVFRDFSNHRLAQKNKYGGEFFPHSYIEGSCGLSFLEFFQRDRTGSAKGIVKIELGDLQ